VLQAIRAEPVRSVVVLIVLVDIALIAAHPFYSAAEQGLRGDLRLRLDKDRGFAELFGALQLVAAAVLLLRTSVCSRIWVAAGWAVALLVIAADDVFEGHEEFGRRFALFDGSLGAVRAKQAREVVAMAVIGLILMVVVGLAHRSSSRVARAWSWSMAAAAIPLVLAGVGLDFVHGQVAYGTWLSGMLTIAEDGGELVAMSSLFVVAVAWWAAGAWPGEGEGRQTGSSA
jgi:ketosteroid isomerase-like protein